MGQRDWGFADDWGSAYILGGKPTGAIAETVPRGFCNTGTTAPLVSGRLEMVAIVLQSGLVISTITWAGAGAAATPTQQLSGLYDSARNQLRVSTNKTNTAWAANTNSTFTLTSTFTTTYTGLHYLGLMQVAGTAVTLQAMAQVAQITGLAPINHGTSNTGLTTTLPNPANALTGIANIPYAYVG